MIPTIQYVPGRAAEQGNAPARHNLGMIYASGLSRAAGLCAGLCVVPQGCRTGNCLLRGRPRRDVLQGRGRGRLAAGRRVRVKAETCRGGRPFLLKPEGRLRRSNAANASRLLSSTRLMPTAEAATPRSFVQSRRTGSSNSQSRPSATRQCARGRRPYNCSLGVFVRRRCSRRRSRGSRRCDRTRARSSDRRRCHRNPWGRRSVASESVASRWRQTSRCA